MKWNEKVKDKKNIIFVGESGCGKTELAMNCAVALAREAAAGKTVNLLDMDQTKGAFRARDYEEELKKDNVRLVCGEHFLDTPVVPHGTIRLLKGEEFINVMDIGGNEIGAITMGQFAEEIRMTKNVIFFVINPFRIFSTSEEHIRIMIDKIRDYGAFEKFEFIANPNMGEYTDEESIREGMEALKELSGRLGIDFSLVTYPQWLEGKEPQQDVIYIKRYLQYP